MPRRLRVALVATVCLLVVAVRAVLADSPSFEWAVLLGFFAGAAFVALLPYR